MRFRIHEQYRRIMYLEFSCRSWVYHLVSQIYGQYNLRKLKDNCQGFIFCIRSVHLHIFSFLEELECDCDDNGKWAMEQYTIFETLITNILIIRRDAFKSLLSRS